uniref:Uncharacterized protein n=1 Tax=Vitis vinifera TaxID=29760 RepID=F6GWK4_VITVI
MEHRLAGVHNVAIQGLNTRTIDLPKNGWGHKVGLNGDKLHLFTQPPSQSVYHVPRAFLKTSDNLLVLFEETGRNPDGIEILTLNRDTICCYISEHHPTHVRSWKREASDIQMFVDGVKPKAKLW